MFVIIILLWVVKVVNLLGVDIKGNLVILLICFVVSLVKFFIVFNFVFIAVLFIVNLYKFGNVWVICCKFVFSCVIYFENFCFKVSGIVFCRWVCFILIILLNFIDFFWSVFWIFLIFGSNCLCNVIVEEMCIVVGNVLLDDCDILIWLLGCIGFLFFIFLLVILIVWLVMILLIFILYWVLFFVI